MKKFKKLLLKNLYLWGLLLVAVFMPQCSSDDGPDLKAPQLTANEASSITRTSATLNGTIVINGNSVSESGFLYSTAEADLKASGSNAEKVKVSANAGTVSAKIEGLEPGTTYYFCMYAKSGTSQILSNILKFTTAKQELAALNKVEVLETSEYSLKVKSSIASDGGAQIKQIGFDYKKASDSKWTSQYSDKFDEGSSTDFTMTLNGLEPETEYIVRSVAINSLGTSYSEEVKVKTEKLIAPVVTTQDLHNEDLGANWAKVVGIIENKGASEEVLSRGFCWSTTNKEPTNTDKRLEVDVDTDEFNAVIAGLAPNTTYYLRAFATNKIDGQTKYGYGNIITFTTLDYKATTFGELTVSDIAASSANLACAIEPGTGLLKSKGFCYSKSTENPTINDDCVVVEEESNDMRIVLNNLDEETTYYVRAYASGIGADGKDETVYSDVVSFETIAYISASFTEVKVEDIGKHSAIVSAVVNTGTVELVEKGFCYVKGEAEPNINDSKVVVEGTDFETTLTGLSSNTTYSIRAYVTCLRGGKTETVYSEQVKQFTTASYILPTLKDLASSNVTKTSATLVVTMNTGDVTITEKGFCWTAEGTPTTMDSKMKVEGDDFKADITGLKHGKTYNYCAYVIYKEGEEGTSKTLYSDYSSFTTGSYTLPAFKELASSNVTKTEATLSATINAGDVTITEKGFCWSTSENPTTDASKAIVEGEELKAVINGLKYNQKYYYRAYAVYTLDGETSTVYSDTRDFTTDNYKYPAVTNSTSDIDLYSAKLTTTLNTEGSDITIVEKGYCWSKNANPTLESNVGTVKIEGDDFSYELNELEPNTTYYVAAYIKYEETGETLYYAFEAFKTYSPTKPTVDELTSVNVTTSSFTVKACVTNVDVTNVQKVGFCWTKDAEQAPEDVENRKEATMGEDGYFTLTVAEQVSGEIFYVYAFAINEAGTSYTSGITVKIKTAPKDEENPSPDTVK